MVTIASWNINSVRLRLSQVERFLAAEAPDVLCLQEIKCQAHQFPAKALAELGYVHQAVHGQKGYHGVATVSRVPFRELGRHDWQDNGEARHVGVELSIDDWQQTGEDVPLLVNLQPAGEYLGEDYYRAGGVPAVFGQLIEQGLIHEDVKTVSGQTIGEQYRGVQIEDEDVIRPFSRPLVERAGFVVMRGNLFNSAIMKTSVISQEFRDRYLSNPDDPDAFEGEAVVFDGPEDYHHRIDDPSVSITANSILFMRGAGPVGYPGAAEVVNMRAPNYLIRQGVHQLPCIGDGRQSGTSGSPSILNASPEAAAGGGLALLKTGDKVRFDLRKSRVDVLVSPSEIVERRRALEAAGGFAYPESQTPWQEMQRAVVGQMETGAVLEPAVKYQRIAQTKGLPRDNH